MASLFGEGRRIDRILRMGRKSINSIKILSINQYSQTSKYKDTEMFSPGFTIAFEATHAGDPQYTGNVWAGTAPP